MRPTLVLIALVALLASCNKSSAPRRADPSASGSTASPSQAPADRVKGAGIPPSTGPQFPFIDRRAPELESDARKKPFGIDALYKVKAIGSPQWSPDGKQILFTVTTHDLPTGKSDTDVYLVQGGGEGLHQLTRFEGSDDAPRWSPDGKTFLFVSRRKEGSQVWLMPIDGGDPRQLTTISTGVDSPIWSPDGKLIAFASSVFPEHGADDKANKAAAEEAEKSPIKAHIADELLFRHWDSYSDGTMSHVLVVEVQGGKVRDLTPGQWESPSFEAGGAEGFAFSSDSSELCFQSNRGRGECTGLDHELRPVGRPGARWHSPEHHRGKQGF